MKIKLRSMLIFIFLLLISGVINQSKAESPILAKPADNSYCFGITDTLFWHPDANRFDYRILISLQSDMSNPVVSAVAQDTFYVTSLFIGTQYWWKVIVSYGGEIPPQLDSSVVRTFTTKYEAPTLSAPVNNATCQSRKDTLQWTYNSGFQFRLQISTVSSFATTVIDMSNISSNSQGVTLPNFATTYYWRVAAVNQGCTSDWSAVRSFTTSQAPPTLISPANKSNGNQISIPFKWSATGSPISYEIQVAADTNFMGIVQDDIVTTPADTIYFGTFNRDYYWRVKTSYSGCETEWSNFFTFKTLYTAPLPILPKRDSSCVPQTTRVEWIAASGASSYRLHVAEDIDFTKIIINQGNITNLADTITVPKSMQAYYWRVRGEDGNNTGIWSDTFRFFTAVGIPERTFPLDNDSGGIAVNFKWKTILDGINYRIQISESPDFKITLLDKKLSPDSILYTFSGYNKTFYWRVMAIDVLCQGPWSATWKYKTVLLPPNLISPADKSKKQNMNPKFQWSAPQGAEKYDFQLAADIAFDPPLVGKSGLPGTSFVVLTDLQPYTTYFWRVYCSNSQGKSSWSKIFSFTTGGLGPDEPVLIFPHNNTEGWNTDVQVKWTASARASLYHLQVSEMDDFQKCLVDLDNIVETSYPLTTLENAKFYYWRVSALNDNGTSNWSDTWSFRTIASAPTETAQLQQPPDGSKDVPTVINFSWTPIPRAEIYEIQIASNEQFDTSNIILADSNLSSNSKYVTTLPYNTELFWRVRGGNEAGKGPWSLTWQFKTLVSSVSDESLASLYKIYIYPNPANETAAVSFILPSEQDVTIRIFNLMGVELAKTDISMANLGQNVLNMDLRNINSGSYIIKISIGTFIQVQNLIIEK